MKTERFATLVEAAGKPAPHLLLISPEQDKVLQEAIKAGRVMTLHQNLSGNKADHGNVGFEPGSARQYLIFPKSLRKFQGSRIVGIKYDLFQDADLSKPVKTGKREETDNSRSRHSKRDIERQQAPTKKDVPAKKAAPAEKEAPAKKDASAEKVVHFTKPGPAAELDEESESLEEIKNQVRHAMEALEQGKQVAAFNLLKRIVEG